MPASAPSVLKVTGVWATPGGQALEMVMSEPSAEGVNVVVTSLVWFQPSAVAVAVVTVEKLPLLSAATSVAASAAFLVSD